MKVMVVDDERDVELLFRQKFRKEIKDGVLQFQFAFSGDEALSYLHGAHQPDVVLILSDINMPGMSGLELLKKVKTEFPDIRISMITAYADDMNYKSAMENGAEKYFTKPIDFVRLRQELFSESI
jgi:two-component system response regulator (stage 0 sporulation protein F)